MFSAQNGAKLQEELRTQPQLQRPQPQHQQPQAAAGGLPLGSQLSPQQPGPGAQWNDVDAPQESIDQIIFNLNAQATSDASDFARSMDKIEAELNSSPHTAQSDVSVKQHDKEAGAGYRSSVSNPCKVVQHQKQPGSPNCTAGVVVDEGPIPEIKYEKDAGEKVITRISPTKSIRDSPMTLGKNRGVVVTPPLNRSAAAPEHKAITLNTHENASGGADQEKTIIKQSVVPSQQYQKEAAIK